MSLNSTTIDQKVNIILTSSQNYVKSSDSNANQMAEVVIPKGPISIAEALELYDDSALADLEFSKNNPLPLPEAFELLQSYPDLPPGKRLIIDKILLSSETRALLLPAGMDAGYWLSRACNYSDLLLMLENSLYTTTNGGDCPLALRFQDPSEKSLRDICAVVQKHVHYKHVKDRFFKGRSEKNDAQKYLQNIQASLARFGGSIDLVGLYEREFEGEKYTEQPEDFARKVHGNIDDAKWNLPQIEAVLNGDPDYVTLGSAFDWLLTKYLSNEFLRSEIERKRYFHHLLSKVNDPQKVHIFALSLKKAETSAPDLQTGIRDKFGDTIEKICRDQRTLAEMLKYFSIGEGAYFSDILRGVFTTLEGLSGDKLFKAISQIDTADLPKIFAVLPQSILANLDHALDIKHLSEPRNLPLIALILRRSPATLEKLKTAILAPQTAGRLTLKSQVKQALALAGTKAAVIASFESDVTAGIQLADETSRKTISRGQEVVRAQVEGFVPKAPKKDPTARAEKPVEPPKMKRPGELSPTEFTAASRLKFDALKIPAPLEANVGVTKKGDDEIKSQIRTELEATAEIAVDIVDWQKDEEKTIAVEENSVLARMGIKAIRFRKTSSFEVEFLFEEREDLAEPTPFCAAVHLDDKGAPKAKNFQHEPLLKAILEVEAVRYFCELLSGHPVPNATNEDILRLLGLEEMPETVFVKPIKAEPPKVLPTPGIELKKIPVEKPETLEARNFVKENWETFEAFIASLKARGVRVEGDFARLQNGTANLTASIKLDKAIPPGGLTVEMDKKHLFGPYIHSVDIFDPEMSRKLMKNLALDPSFLHLDSIDDIDAYFVSANIRFNDKDEQIHACIIPPDFDVYIFGVDPKEIIEKERTLPVAFNQIILRAFKTAATRIDDHSSTHERTYKSSSRRGANLVNRKVREATNTSYPVIVVSWPVPASPKPGQGPSSASLNAEPTNRDEQLLNMFRDISTMAVDDGIVSALMDAGTYLKAADLFRFFSKDPDVKLHQYPDIYMPITSPRIMAEILDIIQNKRAISGFSGKDDPRAWLMDIVETERKNDPENYESAAIKAFEFAANNPRVSRLLLDRYFQFQCRQSAQGTAAPYAETLKKVLAECRKSIGQDLSVEEILEALFEMSPLNPKNLYLATSGAGDYRLPYDFREGGENMPAKCLFDSGYSVPNGASPEVVKIIAGNRLRFSAVTEDWLRGRSRSEKLSFAAEVQNPFRNKKNKPVDLTPQARALLVYEFEGADDKPEYAYVYLGTARDTKGDNVVTGADRLLKYASTIDAMERAKTENPTGNHTDFEDLSKWSTSDLLALERRKIFELDKIEIGGRTRVIRIKPGTLKKITRKKVAILTGEVIGYKQFSSTATSFAAYREGAHNQDLLDLVEPSLNFNPRRAKIQEIFYKIVGMDNSETE